MMPEEDDKPEAIVAIVFIALLVYAVVIGLLRVLT